VAGGTATKATRDGYGDALLELGKTDERIVVLDADLSGSTKTIHFARAFPERFFNVGVAEQNMIGMAAGFALAGKLPFASSFAMFVSGRAWEIVRNAVAYPGLNVKLVATHAGITVGEDGASHQCIEDLATMRVIPGMRVFVPSDYEEARQITRRLVEIDGPCYVRCSRAAVPVLARSPDYVFREGRGELRRDGNAVSLIAAGPLVHEADKAAEILAATGIEARVINMSSIKPLDEPLILAAARETGAIVTCEEHSILGGLGSAVAELVSANFPIPVLRHGLYDVFGQSGTSDALMDHYKLRAQPIADLARQAISLKR